VGVTDEFPAPQRYAARDPDFSPASGDLTEDHGVNRGDHVFDAVQVLTKDVLVHLPIEHKDPA
jgi:hypothetical protein